MLILTTSRETKYFRLLYSTIAYKFIINDNIYTYSEEVPIQLWFGPIKYQIFQFILNKHSQIFIG